MAWIFFSISSGKLNIFMVLHMTQIWDTLEAIWLFQVQAFDPPSPSHEITQYTKRIGFFRNRHTFKWILNEICVLQQSD